ncbi:MAG TPA: HupE/UreJ family protein [Gemmataceae bacterium]|jgi:hydrogenase/urease accessory protein HupE
MRGSTLFLLVAGIAVVVGFPARAAAHPPPPARALLEFPQGASYRLTITCDVAALVMQAPQGHLGEAGAKELSELPDREVQAWIADAARAMTANLTLSFAGRDSHPTEVQFPDPAHLRRSARPHLLEERAETIIIHGSLSDDVRSFRITFPVDLGTVLLIVRGNRLTPFVTSLSPGETSPSLPLTAEADRVSGNPWPQRVWISYVLLGLKHILEGPDHILFVLGLFLLSPRVWPLLGQVTAFTLAHSLTLGLSACGVWSLPSRVVEPIIALSVVAIAAEDMLTSRLHPWRLVLVFAFGLLHGLGFAGALGETGLPPGQRFAALAAFNVGVEAGQLGVLAVAFLMVGWCRERTWYRPRIVVPTACLIALVGLYWTAERILG